MTQQQATPDYIRFVALGDSATYGLGDRVGGECRGWARLLADAIGETHHVSFCNLAKPGAGVPDVRREQLADAVAHQPVIASLVVGLNDVMKSTWEPIRIREELLECAAALAATGAVIITVRFHDHGQVLGLPRWLARPMARRIAVLNEIYDEVHARFGLIRVDLDSDPMTARREFWSADRLHPSELGHRHLARLAARELNTEGLAFGPPSRQCGQPVATRRETARILAKEGGPWIARRVRDLGPWAARRGVHRVRDRITGKPAAAMLAP
ncbi:SGNH/GDSL hydrolase family protein [Nocardioides sp. WS12]|uniref:SGNH/GDSL hydrolase family protein n=1 Tax=Nocardioides sp. WS12 TaxID=2486272 RepID=UPI0015FC1648|nr:SGNH/GDSL hydrolase family protein [Nocardioides sp. WS12]